VTRSAAVRGAEARSAREREVVRLAGAGLSDRAIAERLGVSQRTVESQVVAARRKLGADNRRHAAALLAAYEAD
jgi:DNA-binding CsgD family transcriptional regulator